MNERYKGMPAFTAGLLIVLALLVGLLLGEICLSSDAQKAVVLTEEEYSALLYLYETKLEKAQRIVAALGIENEDGYFVQIGTGFLVNDSTLVSAGHVITDKDIDEGKIFARFPFLEGRPKLYPENPVYSEDGLFVLYKLSASDTERIRSLNIHYFPIASMDKLYEGEPVVFVSANISRNTIFGRAYYSSVIMSLDGEKYPWTIYMKDDNGKAIGILPKGIPGDSGSPGFVLEDNFTTLALAGVVNRQASFARADLLAEFLKKHGISIR